MDLNLAGLMERTIALDTDDALDLGGGLIATRPEDHVLIFTENGTEVARYQSGMVHEALALLTFNGPAVARLIADNEIPLPTEPAVHEDYYCAPGLCDGQFHTAYAFEIMPPMVVFHKKVRSRSFPWILAAPADDPWMLTVYNWGCENVSL